MEPTPEQITSREFVLTPADALRAQMASLFTAAGVRAEEAAIAADILVTADLRGVDTHGVITGLRYVEQLASGFIRADAEVRTLNEFPGGAVLSNDGGLGVVGAYRAMEAAIAHAKITGIGHAGIVDGRHIGMAGYYPMMAARQDMIGLAVTNANAAVRPTGGTQARFGTNPIAFAAPAGSERPFVLDMATSTVANGKVSLARSLGLPIPRGWAVDAKGDPLEEAPAGRGAGWALTPLGETASDEGANFKGYGLAIMVDVLAGVLFGGGTSVAMSYGHNMAWFMAIDIARIRPVEAFKADMDDLIRYLHETPRADENTPVRVAGDPEADAFERRSRDGVPVHHGVLEQLRAKAAAAGVPALV